MIDAAPALQVEGEVYHPRTPSPSDFVVTPENLALELQAFKEGWSRNVWVQPGGRCHELNLWPRALADGPPLTIRFERDPVTRITVHRVKGHGGRFRAHDRAYLARFMWSFDPARYDQPRETPGPLSFRERAREVIEAMRPTWTDGPAFRPMVPPRSRWSVLDEGGPLDGSDEV